MSQAFTLDESAARAKKLGHSMGKLKEVEGMHVQVSTCRNQGCGCMLIVNHDDEGYNQKVIGSGAVSPCMDYAKLNRDGHEKVSMKAVFKKSHNMVVA